MKKTKRIYSRQLIKDEFTALKVSRGRKWQLRHEKAGLCIKCSEPAVSSRLCKKHRVQDALNARKKLNSANPKRGKWVGPPPPVKSATTKKRR